MVFFWKLDWDNERKCSFGAAWKWSFFWGDPNYEVVIKQDSTVQCTVITVGIISSIIVKLIPRETGNWCNGCVTKVNLAPSRWARPSHEYLPFGKTWYTLSSASNDQVVRQRKKRAHLKSSVSHVLSELGSHTCQYVYIMVVQWNLYIKTPRWNNRTWHNNTQVIFIQVQ